MFEKHHPSSSPIPILLIVIISIGLGQNPMEKSVLSDYLEEKRIELNMPGVRAAVRYSDGTIVRAAVGLADKEFNIALDDTVGMPGGSTGKTFVAVLAMMLIDEGLLSLDDPISKWVGRESWYRKLPNADRIQVKHLLSHSSGISDYPFKIGFTLRFIYRVLKNRSAYFTPNELIEYAGGEKSPFMPGEGYIYTDPGYLVLGKIIESATGESYYELLTKRILVPHGLDQIRPQNETILKNISTGYAAGPRNLREDGTMKYDPRAEWTGGGLVTNPTMLVQFYAALADGVIIPPEKVEAMINGGWRNPETPDLHYGYGLFVYKEGVSFGHGGMWWGYRTHAVHFRDEGITIAVQTNRDGSVDMLSLLLGVKELTAK